MWTRDLDIKNGFALNVFIGRGFNLLPEAINWKDNGI